jgi:Cu-processing system permease protein
MRAVFTIALNTFRETVRNKVLYNILLVAGVALVLSMSFGDLSLFSRVQVMIDFGLATMSLTGLLLSVFIGVGMLGVEISSKTVYGALTKPLSREEFILGKFFGLISTLFINFALIALVFLFSIYLMGASVHFPVLYAVVLIALEMAVIVSSSMFFSTFTTPTLAAIFTIGFYVCGHLNDLTGIGLKQQQNIIWRTVLNILYYVFPNLEHFNIRTLVVYDMSIPHGYVASAVCYGVLYTFLLLIFSMIVFSRKDL